MATYGNHNQWLRACWFCHMSLAGCGFCDCRIIVWSEQLSPAYDISSYLRTSSCWATRFLMFAAFTPHHSCLNLNFRPSSVRLVSCPIMSLQHLACLISMSDGSCWLYILYQFYHSSVPPFCMKISSMADDCCWLHRLWYDYTWSLVVIGNYIRIYTLYTTLTEYIYIYIYT